MKSDPYRYFRIEAAELMDALADALARVGSDADARRTIQRHLHTLKGAARVVGLADVGDAAHAAEDLLEEIGGNLEGGDRGRVEAALATLRASLDHALREPERVEARSEDPPSRSSERAPEKSAEPPPRPTSPATDPNPHITVRVPLRRLEALADAVASLRQSLDGLEGEDARVAGLRREVRRLEADADALSGVDCRAIFDDVEYAAHDAAAMLGRTVAVTRRGDELRFDPHVALQVRAALLHAVRNAVAHGIEPPSARQALGKPVAGTIRLHARTEGHRLVVDCADDGAGFDEDALGAELARRGGGSDPRGDALIAELVRHGGSTRETVDAIAGRGVGLAAIVGALEAAGGTLSVTTERGVGATLRFEVPLTLSGLPVLRVTGAGLRAIVPLDAVVGTAKVRAEDLREDPSGVALRFRDEWLPFASLSGALGEAHSPEEQIAVVVQARKQSAAIGVRHLRGTARARVRPIAAEARVHEAIVGATTSRDARPWLLLDPRALVKRAREGSRWHVPPDRQRASVLLVDDSLTTRMLEQAILEGEGYEVVAAEDVETALDLARSRRFDLFVVDVDMPGLDGFAFLEITRSEATLQTIPAIMVTSRTSPEDRARAREAGAAGCMAKGEFDQRAFLDLVAHAVGGS